MTVEMMSVIDKEEVVSFITRTLFPDEFVVASFLVQHDDSENDNSANNMTTL